VLPGAGRLRCRAGRFGPERAEHVAGIVNGLGTKGVTVIGDVLDDAQIPRIVAEAEENLAASTA
jgi:hypothetical protein